MENMHVCAVHCTLCRYHVIKHSLGRCHQTRNQILAESIVQVRRRHKSNKANWSASLTWKYASCRLDWDFTCDLTMLTYPLFNQYFRYFLYILNIYKSIQWNKQNFFAFVLLKLSPNFLHYFFLNFLYIVLKLKKKLNFRIKFFFVNYINSINN